MRPSAAASPMRYRNTSESSTRVSSIARSVESQRGSVGADELDQRHQQRSPRRASSFPCAARMPAAPDPRSSCRCPRRSRRGSPRHCSNGYGNERRSARRIARSTATQHISREYRNSCRPPRTSHMPSSGSCQWSVTQSTRRTRLSHRSCEIGVAVLVVEIHRVHELAVDVELELVVGAVADAHRRRAGVPLEVRE